MPVSEWADMMPFTLTCQPGAYDGAGDWTSSGSAITPACRFEGERQKVRDQGGAEVVSSLQAIVATTTMLTVEGYRYTLPATFPEPRTLVEAIAVHPASDEDGIHHMEVFFP